MHYQLPILSLRAGENRQYARKFAHRNHGSNTQWPISLKGVCAAVNIGPQYFAMCVRISPLTLFSRAGEQPDYSLEEAHLVRWDSIPSHLTPFHLTSSHPTSSHPISPFAMPHFQLYCLPTDQIALTFFHTRIVLQTFTVEIVPFNYRLVVDINLGRAKCATVEAEADLTYYSACIYRCFV
jgi:hypothetical protein